MKYSNTVEYNIKTSLDSKGLTQLRSELQSLELKLQNMGNKGLLDEKTFVDARNQIQGLGQALSDAFNPSLGMLDLSKLNQELKNNDVTAQGLKTAFTSLGAEGQVAFNNLIGELGKLDTGVLRTNSQIDKLFTTFSNTFRWGLVSSFFSQFMNAIHSSIDYVKELDDSLTQIMLVTDYNRDSMNEFAKSANEAAKAVSMTTTGMTNASLIFAQQGYDLGQSQELATLSAKVANASQQDTATTSDQITAYMNAYGLENSIGELTQAMDNWALIANISAADVGELAQASQRAASMANAVGVSGEQLASQIATIESVTREAPEQIGNGLKTLYARFSDIASGKEDEDGFTLGKVTSELNKIGVQVLDEMGQIRDVGDIMEDLMVIWDDLDQTSKVAASQALAGKYQVNRFMALMDNSDMYEEYKGATGANAAGTLDIMNEEYAQSIEGRSAKLQASLEGLFSTIFNTDDIYPWMDAAQGAVDLLQQFFDALGGGKTVLLGISSLLMQVFSKNMAQEINNAATNRAVQQQKLENLQNSQAALTTLGAANPNPNDANSQNIINFAQYMQANAKNFNAEQMDQANSILQELVQNSNAATMAVDKLKESLSVIGTGITATTGESILAPFLDSEGAVNATLLSEALQNMSQSEVTEMFSHIQEDIKPAREGLLEFNKALQAYQQELRNTHSTDDSWSQSLSNLKTALDNLEGKIDPTTYERYEQVVRDIAEVTDNAGDKTAETTAEVAKLADGLEKVAAKDLTNLDQLNKDAFHAKNTQMAAKDSNKVAGAFQEGMGSQAHIQEILNTINAVQQLTFAWQAFQNLGSLWANEDLSTGEKVLQTIMNLTMAMPQLIAAMQTLQNNSFLQNVRNGLLNVLGPGSNFSDIASSVNTFQSFIQQGEEAQQVVDELQYKVDLAKQAMELREGLQNKLAEAGKAGSILQSDKAKDMSMKELQALSEEANKAKEYARSLDEVKEATEGIIKTGKEANEALQTNGEMLKNATKNGKEASKALDQMPGIFTKMYAASLTAGGGITGFKAALDVAKTSMLEFLSVSGPFLAIGLAIGAVAVAIGAAQEQAKKAHDQAIADFEESQAHLEQIQALQEKTSSFKDKYNIFKESGEGGKELAAEAEEIAVAMKDAGMATQGAAIHVAAMRAEISGAAEDFAVLDQEIEKAQFEAIAQGNLEVIQNAEKVLQIEHKSMEQVLNDQEQLKNAQQELNNLDPWKPNYEARKAELESLISTLKETIAGEQEAINAANAAMNAQGQLAGINALGLNGDNNGMQTKARGWENIEGPADAVRTADAETLRDFFSQNVQGFELLNSMEQLDFMLQNVQDDAQKAAIQVQQLLESNNSLGEHHFGNNTYADSEEITQALEQTDLTAENSLQLIASLDKDASKAEIKAKIADVQAEMESNGGDFALALKATLDPEELEKAKEQVKDSISSMEPTDSDLDTENFQETARYFQEMAGELEDVPDEIALSSEALQDFTESILRYDNALQDADEHLDDWKKTLKNSSRSMEDAAEAFEGIRDLVGDLLDLDTSDLSHNFMESADALDLLDTAIYGTGDEADAAYDQLNALANLDMAGMLDWEDGVWSLNDSFNQLRDSAISVSNDAVYAMDTLKGVMEGTISAPEIDATAFVNGLNDMVQSGEMSVDQALAAMDGAQVEADVVTETEDQTDTKNAIGWRPVQTEGVDVKASVPVMPVGGPLANGAQVTMQEFSGHVGGWTFEPETQEGTETKETTVSSVGYKANKNGNGSGKISFKNGRHKAGSGGAKRNNATGGGGHSRPSSGGGGGGSCFVAGTLISTSFGYKPIELIKPDDLVLSYNESLHQNEYSKVIQTMIHDTIEPIYILYIKDEQLRVTGVHRFLISKDISFESQWIAAEDLQIGDWVLLADNTWHLIWKIEINLEHQIVYNFEVAGNHNYYVGRNQILAHNKGGSGKKGGGGSGSGQKAKTAKKKETEKAEKKYYEEVDKQLEQTEKTLKSLEKVTDKLTGTQARAKQNEQLKLLQKEKDLQEKKLKILQEQEKVDVSSAIKKADKDFEDLLKKQGVNFNLLDFTFDEEGFIDNLDSVRESIANGINKLNDQYNAIIGDDGEVTDEEQERLKALDEEIQKLEKIGKEVEKNGTRYNEIVIEEQEIQDEMQEIQDQMQDIAIDAYKASQEAIDNLKDLRKEWAKFSAGLYDSSKGESFLSLDNPIRQLKEIENEISSIYAVSGTEARKYYDDVIAQQQKYLENAKTADEQQAYKDAIEYYEKLRDSIDDGAVLNNGLMQIALNDLTRLQEIWNNWNDEGGNGFFGDDKAALEKALEDAQKRVMEFAQDFEELIEDLKDASLDVVDHTMEQWDRQLDRYDRVIDQLDRYSDTYSLIYGDASYDMQEAVLSQQAQTLKSELDAAQEAYLAANTYYLEAYEKFVDKSTGLAKEGYEDYMYELEEAMNDAEDKVRDIAADAAEKFSEAFEAAVMASTQYILRNTIGENDFEHSDRNWEWDKEYIDKYKDGVEKAYEMDKLRNRYIDMLNNAQGASLQTQNKIRAQMQEQLDLLDGQKTVSEYDVKLANAKLEILQKQIALEDAQRNKNKMQLRRDTQGNYRYVYTADKDNVDQAQQELLDSEYDAYEMSKQQQMNNYDDMINAYKRYLSQREEILTNNNLSEAQKMEQIKELWDRFQKYVSAAQEDFGDATAGTVDILQWLVVNGTDYTATAATDMLNQLLDAEGNVAEQSGVIWMDLANNMANEVIPSIADAVTTADDVIEQKLVQTGIALVGEDGTGGVFGEVSNGANNFGDQCEMAANQTAILAEQSIKLREALLGDNSAFAEAQDQLANYQHQLEDVANASAITAQTLRNTQEALDKANAENLNYRTQIDRLLSGEDIIVDHKIVNAEEHRRKQEEEKRKQQQQSGGGGGRNALADARAIWYHGAWGNGGDWYTPYSRQFGTAAANKVLWYFNHGYGYNFDFDTGGYTGEWNQGEGVSSHKNGKLAFLHQKELILNAQDTENILSAVSMVRSLANSAQASMNNINNAASSNINSIYNPVTEQRVDIQASFPNATDAEDIRQALIGLSDRAYQYAHRVI